MTKRHIFFRADGGSKTGLGHVIRSIALAEMLSPYFTTSFIISDPLPALKEQILAICDEIIVLSKELSYYEQAQFITDTYLKTKDIIVLDGYNFDTKYQAIVKASGCKVVSIDDIHHCHYLSDVIVNHAAGARQDQYSAESYTQFYLGIPYALLRKPFREIAKRKNPFKGNKGNVFVCLGGADPKNDTINILKKCQRVPGISNCYIVIGAGYKHHSELNDFIVKSLFPITLLSNISADDMVKYMSMCPIAVTSPSSISYEYLSVGGALYLHVIADNQLELYDYYISNGLAYDVKDLSTLDTDQRMLEKQRKLFDGNQEQRLLSIFQNL